MDIIQRFEIARKLERCGSIRIGKDVATLRNGLIYIESETPPMNPYHEILLDNPMTWDDFTHIYLLDKQRSDVK